VGRALLDRSPAEGIPMPVKEITRDRILTDDELARVIVAARKFGGPYGAIVEFLALTGQRREEVARCSSEEIDFETRTWTLPSDRTKNGKPYIVHLSAPAIAVLEEMKKEKGKRIRIFDDGKGPLQAFSMAKRELDKLSGVPGWRLHDLRRTCVSGMARLGIPPHVADKILNHQAGTISGVAAVYQRHDFK
jgi:integrase